MQSFQVHAMRDYLATEDPTYFSPSPPSAGVAAPPPRPQPACDDARDASSRYGFGSVAGALVLGVFLGLGLGWCAHATCPHPESGRSLSGSTSRSARPVMATPVEVALPSAASPKYEGDVCVVMEDR
jgi:hypothetical protein